MIWQIEKMENLMKMITEKIIIIQVKLKLMIWVNGGLLDHIFDYMVYVMIYDCLFRSDVGGRLF